MTKVISDFSISDEEARASWKALAQESLKSLELEKVLCASTVEGVNYQGLYDHNKRALELYSFPRAFSACSVYDSGLVAAQAMEQDQSEGMESCLLVVKGKSWSKDFPRNLKLNYLVQKVDRDSLQEFAGEDAFVDSNKLDFSKIESEIERVKEVGLGFAVNMSQVHNAGASVVQEISYGLNMLSALLNAGVEEKKIVLMTAVDSLFFMNIAKLRALRYLAEEVLLAHGKKAQPQVMCLSSLREQTLYDPWVNMLRNCASSMAAVMGGANLVGIRPHDAAYSILTAEPSDGKARRSARHILNIIREESKLDFVMDPAKGSFAVEELTSGLVSQAWENFLNWEEKGLFSNVKDFAKSVEAIAKARYEKSRKRKSIITGVNDFANGEETLESLYNKPWRPVELNTGLFPLRRNALEFEELRIAAEKSERNLKVALVYKGNLSALSARMNFIKNIFETLGIQVAEYQASEILEESFARAHADGCNVLALAGVDSDYAQWARPADSALFKSQFIAGNKDKFEMPGKEGFVDLYMGKNVYSELKNMLVNEGVEV